MSATTTPASSRSTGARPRSTGPAPVLDVTALLADPATEIIVCCGSGGVGKTTTAAALGLRAAEAGRRVVVLTIDPAYFRLGGGIERWLYRLVRKHGGRQKGGWHFAFQHLYLKSGSMARYSDFALDIRRIVARQALPGYRLSVRLCADGHETLAFSPRPEPSAPACSVGR